MHESSHQPTPPSGPRSVPTLKEALRRGPLTLDGGMGTQIYERGVLFSINYEDLCISRPELILSIHEDYVRAGAQVLETNTFGANRIRFARHGLEERVGEINRAAVRLARKAAGERVYVAGAVGPTGLVFGGFSEEERERVRNAFREQVEALLDEGVDALLIETMRQPEELLLAIEGARAAMSSSNKTGCLLMAQVSIDEHCALADGTPVAQIGKILKDLGCDVIGVNCSDGPQLVLSAVEQLLPLDVMISAVPNAGIPRRVDDRFLYVSTPEYFGVFARRMLKLGVRLIGGCCGTTPEHIKRIAAAVRMAGSAAMPEGMGDAPLWIGMGASENIEVEGAPSSRGASLQMVPREQKSAFAAKVGKSFVVSVEVNPPIGLDPKPALSAAKMLIDGGVDVINIADGARAQARMSNVAMAVLMQRELGIETLVHVCGRDRNLLGQVAHLLGAHALGIRNLVVITGDPPKLGDFPDATAVYDLDSIGILRLVSRLNRGIDPGGKPLEAVTSFFAATGAEPAALNYKREIERLKLKKRAGAEMVMTQPVYDTAILDRFLGDAQALELPILIGILPLASHRNAEFLHNEVPGMQIPEDVRARMKGAGSGAEARREGVKIAREMVAAVRGRRGVAGVYIMPPLGRYEMALEVMAGG